MDGYMTDSFFEMLPMKLKSILLDDSDSYYEFYSALNKGRIQLGVSGHKLSLLLDKLNKADPELTKKLVSFVDSGKLRGLSKSKKIDPTIDIPGIRKGVLKQISGCYEHNSDTLFHDNLSQKGWREKIETRGRKPLFLNEDFVNGDVEYLFKEQSEYLNVGDSFNWSRFLNSYVLPFNTIRILDPYLYVNICDTSLSELLKTLAKKSKDGLKIEIISDLNAKSKWTPKELIENVITELKDLSSSQFEIILFNQKGGGKKLFHKRVIWTNFWALYTDRGFDFIEIEKGGGTVKRENTLFISGKYASKDSVWHQIDRNWEEYTGKADLIMI